MIREEMRNRARQLRKQQTPFEHALWRYLRAGRFGQYKFRRQQVIGPYIVDFICQSAKLIVELDGSQHIDTIEYDRQRDEWLLSQGYRVVRIWNHEWVQQQSVVLEKIFYELKIRPRL